MNMNIGRVLYDRANISGTKVGFVRDGIQLTFLEMNRRANGFANYLEKTNIHKGDKIAILCKNNEDAIATFFGAAKKGVITVALNWRLSAEELAAIINHSEAKLVVFDASFNTVVEQLRQSCCNTSFISHHTNPSLMMLFKLTDQEPVYEGGGQEPILMMYTSGTTGVPKGALISHRNLVASSIGMTHSIDWYEKDRFLMIAPFFNISGFAPLVTNVHIGATMVLSEVFDPMLIWKLIEQERITNMMTIPAMLTFLMKTYPMLKPDISSIRDITCGAGVVPVNLILAFKKLGISVQQVYGTTEYSGAVSFWKESQNKTKYMSLGKPVMHGHVEVIDPTTGQLCAAGEIGEIVVSGPQVFLGYYKNEEATAEALKDGRLYTGDLGYIDQEGFIYVVDRLKDVIIYGNDRIYSAEVERVLLEHPFIEDVAVIGMPNAEFGEVPKAVVVKKLGSRLTEEDVKAYCIEKLAPYKCVREVEFIGELPRNSMGKVLKRELKVTVDTA